ncbi:hypothetical protein [Thermosphaera aggregans]|uniref:hypothetical protein n=1 Tax=Thermosphaera aggregans TaxID=54254 RepID=UPI0011E575EE|nr:hypothetical protein [Thermosphaera aggregans]
MRDLEKHVQYEGVVIGVEQPEGVKEPCILVHGRVDDKDAEFYLILDPEAYYEVLRLGIGQQVSGRGVVESSNPLIVRKV